MMNLFKTLCITAFLISATALSMETPIIDTEQNVTVTVFNPLYEKENNLYIIQAFAANQLIGFISYHQCKKDNKIWHLKSFHVSREYRKNNIGLTLFKNCIAHIQNQKGTLLLWKALPLDCYMSLDSLIDIYKRLVEKMKLSEYLTIGKRVYNFVPMQLALPSAGALS